MLSEKKSSFPQKLQQISPLGLLALIGLVSISMPIQVTGTWVAVLVGLSLPAPTLAPWGKFKHFQAKFLQETGGPVARRGNRCWVANHQCALYYLFQRNHQIHAYRFEFTIYAYRFEYWEQRQQKFIFLTWFFLLIIIIIRKDFRTWQFCTLILT